MPAPQQQDPNVNPFDDLVKQTFGADQTRMRVAGQAAADQNPDEAGQALELANQTGLPPEVVQRNYALIKKRAALQATPYQDILNQTPHTAALMQQPLPTAAAKDDLENLGALEWMTNAVPRAWKRGQASVELAQLRAKELFGTDLTAEEHRRIADLTQQMSDGGALGTSGQWWRRAVAGAAEQAPLMLGMFGEGSKYGLAGVATTLPVGMGTGALIGAPAGPAGAAAGALTVGTGLALAGGSAGFTFGSTKFALETAAGQSYESLLNLQVAGQPLDPRIARVAALGAGFANAALMSGAFRLLLRGVPFAGQLVGEGGQATIETLLQKPSVRSALLTLAGTYGKTLTVETANMVAQRAVQILAEEASKVADTAVGGKGPTDFGYGARWNEATQSYSGPPKGLGFFGPLKDLSGGEDAGVKSEFSRDGEVNGQPMQYPLLVPTLTAPEVQAVLQLKEGQPVPASVEQKAQAFAAARVAAGKSPFAEPDEANLTQYPQFAREGVPPAVNAGPTRIPLRSPTDIFADLVQSGMSAATSFALMTLPGPAGHFFTEVVRAHGAAQTEQWLLNIGKGVEQSATAKRAPAVVEQLMAQATAGGPHETLYAPLDDWTTYWQGKGVDPAEMATRVTGDPQAYAHALESKTDLPIPTAKYAVTIGPTEHNAHFAEMLRVGDPRAQNAIEAKRFQTLLDRELRKPSTATPAQPVAAWREWQALAEQRGRVIDELHPDWTPAQRTADMQHFAGPEPDKYSNAQILQALHEEATQRLMRLGYSRAHAETSTAPQTALLDKVAQRTDQDPRALYREYGLTVGGPHEELETPAAAVAGPEGPGGVAARAERGRAPEGAGEGGAAAAEPPGAGARGAGPGGEPLAPAGRADEPGRNDLAAATEAELDQLLLHADPAEQQRAGVELERRATLGAHGGEAGAGPETGQRPDDDRVQREAAGAARVSDVGGEAPRLRGSRLPPPELDERFVRPTPESVTARLTPEVTHELERIRAELEGQQHTGRTWTWLEGAAAQTGNAAGGAADIVAGHGWAEVYKDILAYSPMNLVTSGERKGEVARGGKFGAEASGAKVLAAVRGLLEGEGVKNNIAEGALRVAERRAAGDYHVISRPAYPPHWNPEPTPEQRAAAEAAIEAVDLHLKPPKTYEQGGVGMGQRLVDQSAGATGLDAAPAERKDGALIISARRPTETGETPHQQDVLTSTLALFQAVPEKLAQAATLFRQYDLLTKEEARTKDPAVLIDRAVTAMQRNLRALWDAYPAEWRERAQHWYVGANRIAHELAATHGVSVDKAAGVLAALSPAMDWFKNVSLADRVLRSVKEFEQSDPTFTPELFADFERRAEGTYDDYVATRRREAQRPGGKPYPRAEQAADRVKFAQALDKVRVAEVGASWKTLTIEGKARLLRAIDERTPRDYSVISPEGDRPDLARNANGKASAVGWSTYAFIENAISIAYDGSPENISARLGNEHKVRSFFNNVSHPFDPRFVTIDTHAVGAAFLQPFSLQDEPVKNAMGQKLKGGGTVPQHAPSGLSGTNGIIAQAYFNLAHELGVDPRVLQSVTWEAVRSLFEPGQKRGPAGVRLRAKVAGIFRQYERGKISHGEFVTAIQDAARTLSPDAGARRVNGFAPPAWLEHPVSEQGRLAAASVSPRLPELSAGPGGGGVDSEGAAGARPAGPDGALLGPVGRAQRGEGTTYEQGPKPDDQAGLFDTLDTGEQQPRLPGDVGAARDQETKTPTLAEAPFALTSEGAPAPKPKQNPLFQAARGSISFGPNHQVHISLFEGKDLSSYLHENGHFILELMGDQAEKLQAMDPSRRSALQNTFISDYGEILKFLGVQDRSEIGTPQHEQLARAFEAYLMEGKAPSAELRGVFRTIKQWMVEVYGSLKALNVNLTPEVRGVFDRLLATDEAIQQAQQAGDARPLFTTAAAAGMTDEAFAKYRDVVQQASNAAQDELERQAMSQLAREKKRWWRTAREETRTEVLTAYNDQPLYRALALIKDGTRPDGTPIAEGVDDIPIKLAKADLEGYPPEVIDALRKHDAYRLEGGVAPEALAELTGFSSADEMIKAIAESPTLARAVEQETTARMQTKYPDLTLDGSLPARATAAVFGEGRQRVVEAELKALTSEMVRGTIPSRDVIQAHAEARIKDTRVRDLKPGLFLAAAQRASAKAFELLSQGKDRVGAVEAKQQELVNLALYREATQALDYSQATAEYMRSFDRKGVRARLGKAGGDYLDRIDSIRQRFDFSKQTLRRIDSMTSLERWAKGQEAAHLIPLELPDAVLNESRRTNYVNLTVDELRDVRDAVTQIAHFARLKDRLLENERKRTLSEVALETTASIIDHAKKTLPQGPGGLHAPGTAQTRRFATFLASHIKLATFLREMDGFKDGGPLWEYGMRRLNEAGDAEAVMNEKATIAIGKIFDDAYTGEETTLHKPLYISAIDGSLSKAERLMVALNWGNADGRQRLRDGYHWTDDQVQAILHTLDARDVKVVNDLWAHLESYWPEIAAKQRRVTGIVPPKVVAAPFQTLAGDFTGGYFPLKYEGQLSARAAAHVDATFAEGIKAASYTAATTDRGHTKARLEHVELPVRLDLGVITQHLNQVIHDLTHHEPLMDVSRVLGHKDVQSAIYRHYGDITYGQIKGALRDIGFGSQPAPGWYQTINSWRAKSVVSALAWNTITSLMHTMQIGRGMVRVGPGYVVNGLGDWAVSAKNAEGSVAWIEANSDFMRLRWKTGQRDLNEVRNQVGLDQGKVSAAMHDALAHLGLDPRSMPAIADSYFYMIRKIVQVAEIPTFLGAYEKAMQETGADHDQSIQRANQAVIDSMGSGMIKDLSMVQRADGLSKIFTTFYDYHNAVLNQVYELVKSSENPGRKIVDATLLLVVPVVLGTMITHYLMAGKKEKRPRGESEWAMWAKELGAEGLDYGLNFFVGAREFSGALTGRQYAGPAGLRMFNTGREFIHSVGDLTQEEFEGGGQKVQKKVGAALKASNDLAGGLFGYPAKQIDRTAAGIQAVMSGKSKDYSDIVFGPRPAAATR